MVLSHTIIGNGVPVHELATGDVLRPLDATEHNMERLNARARGSGRTYHTLLIEGPLSRAELERALDAVASRHPLLRVRIVRSHDGKLSYAPTRGDRDDGTARVPVSYLVSDDSSAWPELVEADMNAGAIATARGPLFAFALLEPPGLEDGASGRRLLVEVGHHSVCDGLSSIAMLHDLLEQLAEPRAVVRLEDRPLIDPFCLDVPVPELDELEAQARNALGARNASRRPELEQLHARFEELEQRLLAQKDAEGRLPIALKAVHSWLSSLWAALHPATGVVPEVEVRATPDRYERVRTALLYQALDVETTRALGRAAKEHGLTMYGVFAATMLIALAAERASGVEAPAVPRERLALATAVSLRNQLVPPLSAQDLRMAVDILVSRIPVEPGARFWDLARSAREDVTHAVARARALSSSFRTAPRNFSDTPPGHPLPLLSNLGRVQLSTQYGPLKLLEFSGAMATHGSFQLAALFFTFDERLAMTCYCETPTVSRAKLERFAARILDLLKQVAAGEEPTVPG